MLHVTTKRDKIKEDHDKEKQMDVKVETIPARIVGGPTIKGYAVICDSQIREWYRSRTEAERVAEIIKQDSQNPEDY